VIKVVYITTCEICGTAIEVEGNEPHRCPMHTEQQINHKKNQALDLDTVDYLMEKYVFNP
jgi:hypothetical protein